MSLHWSIHQLTDYLTEISGQQDEKLAMDVAAERAAEALDAEVAAVVVGGAVLCCVGFGLDEPPPELVEVARVGGMLEVAGLGELHAAASDLRSDDGAMLIVGRVGEPLGAEELQVLHGMARMLGLAVRGMRTLGAERLLRVVREREAAERLELLHAVQERQRLVETLLEIQRTISSRKPLQDVLDTITSGASGLFEGWAVSLVLPEPLSADLHHIASAQGRRRCDEVAVRAAGAAGTAASSAGGLILQTVGRDGSERALIAAPVHVEGEIAGSLVADLPAEIGSEAQWRELLIAFAQQVSLALTDARTVEAMREAFHDPLTGLANRALFLDLLEQAYAASATGRDLTVVYLDLDGFKAVNDTSGHQAGDELLRLVAGRITACLRDGDTAARLGGDEFAVLLDGSGQDIGVEVAERIISRIKEPFLVGDREVFVGASAGVAQRLPSSADSGELLGSGDVAMYRAKQAGRGRVVVFEPGMEVSPRQRMDLQGDLRAARGFDDFRILYQPIVRLDTRETVGVEALLRWDHPVRGVIAPAEFVPVAEETGVIRELGRWALETSASEVSRWRSRFPGMRLSVNVSARQLGVRLFPDEVAGILARTGLPGHALTLELTETALMFDPESALQQLEELRELGVRISVDDFGTGYSALSYLRRFPVDEVKIDHSFVAEMTRGPDDLALVRAVVELGRALRLRTVAEGVETPEQLAALGELGCEYAQGYLLARPLDPGALEAHLLGLPGDRRAPAARGAVPAPRR